MVSGTGASAEAERTREEDGVSDETIRGAANQVWETAGAVERAVNEVLAAFREGRFDPEPVGSPAYVRRLRDQAAVAVLNGIESDASWSPSWPKGASGWSQEKRDEWFANLVSAMAVRKANALIAALGYRIPEDTP